MIRVLLKDAVRTLRTFMRQKLHWQNQDLPYYVAIGISVLVFIIALNGFVELTDELAENELTHFDDAVTEYVVSFRSDALTSYLIFCTHLGDRYAYLIITILLVGYFLLRKLDWRFVLQVAVVLMLATLSNVVLKRVINRARPDLEHLVAVNTLSYPSGHSMSAMAFYGFLVYLCMRYDLAGRWRPLVIALFVLIIASVGISRIYLGVHFPSDVAGGFIGGLIWVAFCAVLFNLIGLWRNKRRLASPGADPVE